MHNENAASEIITDELPGELLFLYFFIYLFI